MMSFEELEANARAAQPNSPYTLPALRDYLTPAHLAQISDEALAQARSYYEPDRGGDAIKVVSIIAGEQRRRSSAEAARSQATADLAIWWSRWGAWAAIIGALAAVVAAIAAVAVLIK